MYLYDENTCWKQESRLRERWYKIHFFYFTNWKKIIYIDKYISVLFSHMHTLTHCVSKCVLSAVLLTSEIVPFAPCAASVTGTRLLPGASHRRWFHIPAVRPYTTTTYYTYINTIYMYFFPISVTRCCNLISSLASLSKRERKRRQRHMAKMVTS